MTSDNAKQFKVGSISIPAGAEHAEAMLEDSLIAQTPAGVFVTSWQVGVDGYPVLHFLIGGLKEFVDGHPRRVKHTRSGDKMILTGRACDMLAHWLVLTGDGPESKPASAIHEEVKVGARRVVALLAKLSLECLRKPCTVMLLPADEPDST